MTEFRVEESRTARNSGAEYDRKEPQKESSRDVLRGPLESLAE